MKPSRPNPPAAPPGELEVVFGVRAALAVLEKRANDIERVAYSSETRDAGSERLRWAAANERPARELRDDDLTDLAGSNHHEGLCVVTRARRWTPPAELAEHLVRVNGTAIALDRVRNPYNIGAILRSAAFFGVDAALLGAPAPHPALAPGAVRVAEGGVEHLLVTRTTDLVETLTRLRGRGIQIVGAESDAQHNAIGYAFRRPTVLVLGNEREGISPRVRAACDALVAIPGNATIDSLNVSIAASLMMAEMTREALQRRSLAPVAAKPAAPTPPARRR